MDNQQEMLALQELFDIVKELTGYMGDIMMQYAGGGGYVEQRGVHALLMHLHRQRHVESSLIRLEACQAVEARLQGAHIPYAAFEVGQDDWKARMYVYRDSDGRKVKDIIQGMEYRAQTYPREYLPQLERDVDVGMNIGMESMPGR